MSSNVIDFDDFLNLRIPPHPADRHEEERGSGVYSTAEPESGGPWNLISHEDLISPPRPVDWVCEAMRISYGNPTLFAGEPTSRKTLMAQHMAVCIAAGKPIFGEWAVKQGNVGHLDYEMGPRLVTVRFQRLARGVGADLADLPRGTLSVGSIPIMFLDKSEAEERLHEFMEGKVFCSIDSLRNSSGGIDENDSGKIIPLMQMIQRVSERTRCAVTLVHHTRKKAGGGDKGDSIEWDDPSMIRGSGGIVGASQGIFMFNGGDAETPTKVAHVRERWNGRKLPKFRVASQDVPWGEDPKGALVVTSMLEDLACKDDFSARDRALDARILAFLAGRPGKSFEGGMTAMRAVMGGKQNDVAQRLHVLVDKGLIQRSGTYREPVYSVR